LLFSDSTNTFPWQGRIAGGVVFYTARVVSKESGQLVFPELLFKLYSIKEKKERQKLNIKKERKKKEGKKRIME
jgi:hypothetical protein